MSETLSLLHLSKRFGERTAVDDLTFEVSKGEIFGLLGPNGAGKTTTVRMLTGLLSPSQGEAWVCGHSVKGAGEWLRRSVGLLTEQPGLYDRLTGRENLLFFIKLHELDERTAWTRAAAYLERFGLKGREDEPCGTYSKGMRQKLAIIRAIVHQPEVVFLDEPTSGLDPEAARTVRDAVEQLAEDGRTIVMCSHNLAEVERLCSRVAVIRGRLLALSTVKDLRRAGVVVEIRLESAAERFEASVKSKAFCQSAVSAGKSLRVVLDREEQVPEIIATLVGAGARIYSVQRNERPLEEVYLQLMRESNDGL